MEEDNWIRFLGTVKASNKGTHVVQSTVLLYQAQSGIIKHTILPKLFRYLLMPTSCQLIIILKAFCKDDSVKAYIGEETFIGGINIIVTLCFGLIDTEMFF